MILGNRKVPPGRRAALQGNRKTSPGRRATHFGYPQTPPDRRGTLGGNPQPPPGRVRSSWAKAWAVTMHLELGMSPSSWEPKHVWRDNQRCGSVRPRTHRSNPKPHGAAEDGGYYTSVLTEQTIRVAAQRLRMTVIREFFNSLLASARPLSNSLVYWRNLLVDVRNLARQPLIRRIQFGGEFGFDAISHELVPLFLQSLHLVTQLIIV